MGWTRLSVAILEWSLEVLNQADLPAGQEHAGNPLLVIALMHMLRNTASDPQYGAQPDLPEQHLGVLATNWMYGWAMVKGDVRALARHLSRSGWGSGFLLQQSPQQAPRCQGAEGGAWSSA